MLNIGSNLDHIERLIYDAATDSRRWPNFLEEMKKVFTAKAAVWAESDLNGQNGKICHSSGIDYEFISSYEQRYAQRNPWLYSHQRYSAGQVGRGEDIIGSEELVKTEFYERWLFPQGLHYRLCAVVGVVNGRVFYISVLRSREAGSFEDQYLQIMKTLIPHLQKATQRGEYLWRLAIMFDVFDDLPFAVMAVNKQGRLLFSNRSAEVLLRIDDGVNRREGKICISGQNNTTRFAELIRNMASGTIRQEHGNKLGNALMVRRQGKQLPLWVVVSPLGRRLRRVIGQEDQVAIIFVVSPERLGNISEVTLRTLFGLTLKEQKLAKLIIEGYRLDEAATHLNISVNTARTHMKRIYAKTDTGRQTDLVRLLLTGTFNHVSVA